MTKEVILASLEKAGVSSTSSVCDNPITTVDFYDLGLTGGANSKAKRRAVCKALDLPEFLSTSSLISCINNFMTKEEFFDLCQNLD